MLHKLYFTRPDSELTMYMLDFFVYMEISPQALVFHPRGLFYVCYTVCLNTQINEISQLISLINLIHHRPLYQPMNKNKGLRLLLFKTSENTKRDGCNVLCKYCILFYLKYHKLKSCNFPQLNLLCCPQSQRRQTSLQRLSWFEWAYSFT